MSSRMATDRTDAAVIDPRTGTLLTEEQATLAKNVFRYASGTVIGRST